MTRVADLLEPTPSDEPETKAPTPGQRAERLAGDVKDDARREADAYLRETIVPEGGE